jgi:hypothetical protein
MGGLADHLFAGEEEHKNTIFCRDDWYRNVSAVTAACLLVSRQVYNAVNGFDEEFELNFSDIDFCLKVRQMGLRIVYTPNPKLIHHESNTHKRRIPYGDFVLASKKLSHYGALKLDPYFNPNLSYLSVMPTYNQGKIDQPQFLNDDLLKYRLPKKKYLLIPDDYRKMVPLRLRAPFVKAIKWIDNFFSESLLKKVLERYAKQ